MNFTFKNKKRKNKEKRALLIKKLLALLLLILLLFNITIIYLKNKLETNTNDTPTTEIAGVIKESSGTNLNGNSREIVETRKSKNKWRNEKHKKATTKKDLDNKDKVSTRIVQVGDEYVEVTIDARDDNIGEDATRPLRRFDIREQYRDINDDSDKYITILRYDVPVLFPSLVVYAIMKMITNQKEENYGRNFTRKRQDYA